MAEDAWGSEGGAALGLRAKGVDEGALWRPTCNSSHVSARAVLLIRVLQPYISKLQDEFSENNECTLYYPHALLME